jgi:D-alanyl-D-alanine carboxypeptidase/D-alanyl-D-alanine-endopeptidase (penicillin-binding protein 4)
LLKRYIVLLTLGIMLAAAQLPQAIEDIIFKAKVNKDNLSILIINKKNREIVASLNPYKEFSPASVAKVATCYASLLEFGKNFRWPTQLFYSGNIKNGILYGDLVVKAYGDPSLTSYNLSLFAKKLASYGIREIKGDLIIDRSFFVNSNKISSGFDKNYVSQYNSMPDAIMLNDHLNTIKVVPKD